MKNQTIFPEAARLLYVTDFLKNVRVWPSSPLDGPLTPNIFRKELYESTNGFRTRMEMNGTDPNTWCIKDSGFGKFLEAYEGLNSYTFTISVNLQDFS